jgi:hypothetical protein
LSEVNKQQVGGTHYKTAYEHWDLVIDFGWGPEYLASTATKYIARWRKKNGPQDLEKALHYLNKLIENRSLITYGRVLPSVIDVYKQIAEFTEANDLTVDEAALCRNIMLLKDERSLYNARDVLIHLMEQADRAQPVPASDSNKHAER